MKLANLFMILTLLPLHALAAPAASPELTAKGQKSFTTNCAICHGAQGKGDGAAAAALNPKPRNLATDAFTAGTKPDQVFASITKGLKGTNMQGFPSLSEEERWGLVYYILSLRK